MTPRKATEAILFAGLLVCLFAIMQATAQALAAILSFAMVAVQ